MSLGSDLEKVFIELTSEGEFQEVELFTKLQDSFILLIGKSSVKYKVSIIHGSRSMVEFMPKESWIDTTSTTISTIPPKNEKCELSDLFFVVYDENKNKCRIFFMQAKNAEFQKKEKFEADLIQLDLLHNRSPFNCAGSVSGNILAAANPEKQREACIELLTKDISEEEQRIHQENISNSVPYNQEEMPYLDYIFTIDIFNEGVDIPEINQVLMLRPTESPIVFVQQLGRGLRKADDKEYVVIIDFIGNYTNNYMIPIALSGDRSYNKDSIRRYVSEGTRIIPGASTIHFDEISRKRIFQSIDSARMNDVKLLKESYEQLRYRIGRIPTVLDFKKYGSIDVSKYFAKFGSYYSFLVKYYGDEYNSRFNSAEESIIEFISKKVTNMKRIHELALLQHLLRQDRRILTYYEKILNDVYHTKLTGRLEESVVRNLTNEFPKEEERKKYKDCILIQKTEDGYQIEEKFRRLLAANPEFSKMLDELIKYGIENYLENYSDLYKDTNFQLYQKYTYEDVCRLLNWQKNMNAQNIGGYFYDSETKTLPVFINYDKAEDAIAYEDRFVTQEHLIALSKHPRKVDSSDADHFFKRKEADKDNKILLFVRKNKDDKEAKEFYFLGEVFAQGEPNSIKMDKTGDDAFEINYKLDVPVRDDIYEYIVSEA